MQIAFEAKRFFESGTGFGTYSRTLVRDLADHFPQNRYFLYAPESERNLSMASRAHSLEVDRVVSHESVRVVFPPDKAKLYWKLIGARKALREHQIDLYHGLTQQIPRSIRGVQIPKILTMHDLIYRRYPEFCKGENLEKLDSQLHSACTVSDKIVAVSESTKSDLVGLFGIESTKIDVIYSACDGRYWQKAPVEKRLLVRERYRLPPKYLLYVGSMSERKNLISTVKALAVLSEKDRIPLVVIGARTAYTAKIIEWTARNGLDKWLKFAKGVTTEDLPAIYQGAEIFLYPSLYEGFGMPVLEAITSGVPVVTSDTSAMPEAGGPSTRLVEPRDEGDIAKAIREISTDLELKRKMIEDGRSHALGLRSDVVTEKMMSLYFSEIKKSRRT